MVLLVSETYRSIVTAPTLNDGAFLKEAVSSASATDTVIHANTASMTQTNRREILFVYCIRMYPIGQWLWRYFFPVVFSTGFQGIGIRPCIRDAVRSNTLSRPCYLTAST